MRTFQCSSASRKFLNCDYTIPQPAPVVNVSVLFSEPKIPQSAAQRPKRFGVGIRFSALQRAENSSICVRRSQKNTKRRFQCSSASRKFLNSLPRVAAALRRCVSVLFSEPKIPQSVFVHFGGAVVTCFSALQRAENSSMDESVQRQDRTPPVSVLFSEPKIPQSFHSQRCTIISPCFSALQRAENSSIEKRCSRALDQSMFQCSSASRKFLNANEPLDAHLRRAFQCSSASRKFLNLRRRCAGLTSTRVSVLFSEPKIPQFFAVGAVVEVA